MDEIQKLRSAIDIVLDFLSESPSVPELSRADAVFVFGNYQPLVPYHAADLWRIGKAPRLIVTGKGGKLTPQGYATEADFFKTLIVEKGVPADAVVLEREAMNTLENIRFGMQAAKEAGLVPSSLILCAIPFLLKRASATFRKQFPDVAVQVSAFSLPENWLNARRVNRILGELTRLHTYAGKGDLVPVSVPEAVMEAAEQIRAAQRE